MVWKTVESQGKVSEKPGNFEMDIEWQPCFSRQHFQMHFFLGALRVNLLPEFTEPHKEE